MASVTGVIDLHTHSTISDGSERPARVVELAAAAGLSALALTDHDRLDGIDEARRAAVGLGIDFVPGCELSCSHQGTMHLLVYFVEPGDGPLQDELVSLQRARDDRNAALADRLASLGLPVSLAEMEREAGGSGVGRPHVAAVLVRKGVVGSVQEAFDTWLAKGGPAYVPKRQLSPREAVRLARASGGVAVLAHPLSLGLPAGELAATLSELAEMGLGGVEAVYGRYQPCERARISDMAAAAGLAVTGGSDFHGTYKPDLRVGAGTGDLDVRDDLLEHLEDLRPRP